MTAPGGEIAWPNVPATDGRAFGVRDAMPLLSDKGARGLEGVRMFCVGTNAGFLIAVVGRDMDEMRLGVPVGVAAAALTILLLGTVIDMREEGAPALLGVVGRRLPVPSLVVGLPGLLLFDMADAGRRGGGMLLYWLKKLDLRPLLLPFAGEEGSWARLSMVRSESEGRDFLFSGSSGCTSGAYSGEELLSWRPALEPAREDARDAERKPLRLPNTSSSLLMLGVRTGCEGVLLWREGGRAKGFLKAGAFWLLVRGGGTPEGMLLTRLAEDGTREARLGFLVSVAFALGFGAGTAPLEAVGAS